MKFINNNPYRILGLPVTATDRQIAKRASDLSVYAEMGKAKTYEFDFDDLAHLDRSPNAIGYATRQLEQPKDKLIHSIFWLNYDSKENYLQQLNNDNFAEGLENFPNSTVQNLQNKAVLTLFPYVNKDELKRGIKYFDKFLTHPKINNFISEIVGERLAQHFGLYNLFIAQILPYLMKKLESNELLNIFNSTSKAEYVKGKLVRPIVNNIESEIKTTKNKTNSEPTNAYKFGKELIDNTAEKLTELKSILLVSDLNYTSISNKLAEQILNCSIAYFNKNFESAECDIGHKALELANTSRTMALSNIITQRIEKNIPAIKEWIANAPLRKKRQSIKKQNDIIIKHLEKISGKRTIETSLPLLGHLNNIPEEVELFLDSCFTPLFEIRDKLGMNDDLYVEISSVVSNVAISIIIDWYNNHQAPIYLNSASAEAAEATAKVFKVFKQINRLDMDSKTSLFFSRNFSIIKQNNKQQNGNCYIATMVYGDYDAPEVLVLRKFRDNKLSKTIIGKCFIAVYYKYSPKFVKQFKNNKLVNDWIRSVLNKFIGAIE